MKASEATNMWPCGQWGHKRVASEAGLTVSGEVANSKDSRWPEMFLGGLDPPQDLLKDHALALVIQQLHALVCRHGNIAQGEIINTNATF